MNLYERLLEEKSGHLGEVAPTKKEWRELQAPKRVEATSLHGRLLSERVGEEQRRGRPLGTFYRLDSVALEEALRRRPGCGSDLYKLYRFINEGVGGSAAGMWLGKLKNKYPEEYAMLKAECEGELYEQQNLSQE